VGAAAAKTDRRTEHPNIRSSIQAPNEQRQVWAEPEEVNVRMFGSFDGIPTKSRTTRRTTQRGWSLATGQRAKGEDAKQVKCLIASAGGYGHGQAQSRLDANHGAARGP